MHENQEREQIENVPEKHLPIVPLTRAELHEDASERISLITEEFKKVFDFLKNYPKSVTVFGGARWKEDDLYYKKARDLAVRITKELNYSIFTGGGPGI